MHYIYLLVAVTYLQNIFCTKKMVLLNYYSMVLRTLYSNKNIQKQFTYFVKSSRKIPKYSSNLGKASSIDSCPQSRGNWLVCFRFRHNTILYT